MLDSSGVLVTNPRVGNSVFTQNNAKWLFSPRVGLAWDVFGNGKTAVRAGFGTYYSLIDDLAFLLNSLPPYNGSLTSSGRLSSIVPITPGVPDPPSCGPGVPSPCATYAPQGMQANAKTPTVEEWNLAVEQELNRNTAFRVAYVGSHGYHGFRQHRSERHSRADLRERQRLPGGRRCVTAALQPPRQPSHVPRARNTSRWERGRIRFSERDSSGSPKATPATTRWKRK